MLRFLVGAAVIVAPGRVGLPVALVLGAVKGAKALAQRRKRSKQDQALSTEASAALPSPRTPDAVPPVTLAWNNIHATLKTKDGETKTILNSVSGTAKSGCLTAIMGPSGSGKTSLLNALAGQVAANKAMELTGSVTVNGKPSSKSKHRQAYIQQEDVFYSMLTAAETLDMAAQLRLPPDVDAEQRQAYVSRLVATLGLSKALNTRVGDKKTRGLSGGEKKRLSIGCELIGSPSLLFLDEPTTGLDAFAANRVVATLKDLATAGHTVITSIHQPRSSIFALVDDLVLMTEGDVVYCGPAHDAIAHFASLGHPCPAEYNPADFLADLISIDHSSPEVEEETKARVDKLVKAWKTTQVQGASKRASAAGTAPTSTSGAVQEQQAGAEVAAAPRVSWMQQLKLLFVRSWRQATRDKGANIARVMANVNSAIIFAAIFFRMKRSQSSIQDRMGLLQVAAINTAMSSMVKTLAVFPKERVIVSRERAKNSYATAPYLAAKLLAELPIGALFPALFGVITYPLCGLHPKPSRFLKYLGILTLESFTSGALGLAVGAIAPSAEAANAIGPAVQLVWIVFGGYYANVDNVPRIFRWLPSASLIKQGFQALCLNEFPGLTFEPDASGRGMTDGEQVLSWLSFDNTSVADCVRRQARILGVYYWATYCILEARKNSFMAVQPAKQLSVANSASI